MKETVFKGNNRTVTISQEITYKLLQIISDDLYDNLLVSERHIIVKGAGENQIRRIFNDIAPEWESGNPTITIKPERGDISSITMNKLNWTCAYFPKIGIIEFEK